MAASCAYLQRRAPYWARKGRCRTLILRMTFQIDLDFGVMRGLTYFKYAPLRFSEATTLGTA